MKLYLLFLGAILSAYIAGLLIGLALFGNRTPDPDVIKLTNERDSLLNEATQWQIDYAACAKARYENRTINELPLRK
jgi:hypothetical protein